MNRKAGFVLALGVIGVSMGSLFVRLADSPALATAAYRMTFSFLMLLPFALLKTRKEIFSLSKREIGACALAGFFLAAHFGTWISSLDHTSVANSVVLVNTIPIWVGIIGPLAIGEKANRSFWLACGLCLTGAFVLCGKGFSLRFDTLTGDGLALTGAFFVALYLMIGRNLRKKLSLLAYATVCYGSASVFLWIAVLISGQQANGFSNETWIYLICLAVVSQIFGHTLYNWSLQWIKAAIVSLALLGEPIGAILLAWAFLGETIDLQQGIGGSLILFGVYMVARNERRKNSQEA
ncbi:DMT family transporter [Verrucomicrobia bacterium]|nr:DMT family transporter [Verrucomicrobiota bacterium]